MEDLFTEFTNSRTLCLSHKVVQGFLGELENWVLQTSRNFRCSHEIYTLHAKYSCDGLCNRAPT